MTTKINPHASGEFLDAINKQQAEWDDEVKEINEKNEWLHYLSGNIAKTPYLKATGKLKKKPNTLYASNRQRRVYRGSK